MKGKRLTEEQIMRLLHEAETLDNVREVCRQHNIAEQTLYRWRRQFGGMEVSEAKRLRTLERENAALKRLVGELTLDNRMLKDVLGQNWSAWLSSARQPPISSRRMMSASGVPAGSWRCTVVRSGGSPASRTRPR